MALSDIEIAQAGKMLRVTKIAEKLGIPDEHLVPMATTRPRFRLNSSIR
jgi:formyltetrahydrofolate synthetase